MSTELSGIMVDTKLKKFIELRKYDNDTYSVYLKDIDETFWFNNKTDVQEFFNIQTAERFYDKELRKGYFEYINEANDIIVYKILEINRGTIIKFESDVKKISL